MTKNIRPLLKEAKDACRNRGHKMGPWTVGSEWYGHIRKSTCFDCGKSVWVNARPQPNDTEISGEAVALNCC